MGNVGYYGGRAPALPTTMVQSGAPARSDIVINQASRARALYEMLSGGPVAGMTPCAPLPAHSGVPGHDHSGGVFGTPIVRGYSSWVFGYEDATLGANVTNGRAPQSTVTNATRSGQRAYIFRDALKHIWIPGSAPDGAHVKGRLRAVFYSSGTVTVFMKYGTAGNTFSKSLAAGRNVADVTPNCRLRPGSFNRIPMEVWIEGDGVNTFTVALRSLSLNQISNSP